MTPPTAAEHTSPSPAPSAAEHLVALDAEHPGFRDPSYRRRRDLIAQIALDFDGNGPVPEVVYTPAEHAVWRTVLDKLRPLHARYACEAYRAGQAQVHLEPDEIPQLRTVNAQIAPLTGFQMVPVAGLVSPEAYLGSLARGVFLSTQYIRHHSRPLYTPEPDIIHELVGHAVMLGNPMIADLNRRFGEACLRGKDVEKLSRVYWYSVEFGLIREHGTLRAFGAGLMSSSGELEQFERNAALRPFDPEVMANTTFDPTNYQHTLFVAEGFSTLVRDLSDWLAR